MKPSDARYLRRLAQQGFRGDSPIFESDLPEEDVQQPPEEVLPSHPPTDHAVLPSPSRAPKTSSFFRVPQEKGKEKEKEADKERGKGEKKRRGLTKGNPPF